jgi:DNA-binding transcriptional regulator YdaS (Cro superfamily)
MPERAQGLQHAIQMFGSAAELGRAIGIHRAAVTRWASGEREVPEAQQLRILEAGIERGFSAEELAWALNVKRCPCCDTILDDDIRNAVQESGHGAA